MQSALHSFFLMGSYNNRFAPIYENPRTKTITGQNGLLNTNRDNCFPCDNATKQQKLSIRHHPTPWRVPYNHYRKSYTCPPIDLSCNTNEKIIKDVPDTCIDGELLCSRPIYTNTRLVNKSGIRIRNNGGNYNNYLQTTGKLYNQNAFGILPENQDLSGINLYKINTVNGTKTNPNCKINYELPNSLTTKTIQKQKIATATRKWANPSFNSRTSVNSRNRIQKLKYNTILGGQMNKKGGYNNCINGEECNRYVNPGPNTKLFSLGSIYNVQNKKWESQCRQAPRINGMRQSCPPPLPPPPPTYPLSGSSNYLNWSLTSSIVINIPSPINFSSIQVTGVSPGFLNMVQHSFISTGFIQLHENFGAAFSNIPSAMIINTNVPMMVVVYDPAWEPFVNYNALMTMFVMSDYNGSNIKSPDYDYNDITVTISQGSRTTSVPQFSQSGTHWFGPHPFGFASPLANESLNFQEWDGDSYNGGSVGSHQFDDITTPLFSPGITITISTV